MVSPRLTSLVKYMSTGVPTTPFFGNSLHLLQVLSKLGSVKYHPELSGPGERNTEQAVVARCREARCA